MSKLQGVKLLDKAGRAQGVSAHRWRISCCCHVACERELRKVKVLFAARGSTHEYFRCREKASWGRSTSDPAMLLQSCKASLSGGSF